MRLRSQVPWKLPFLTTTPLTDVAWTVALLPLWWALGIEQFVPPAAAAWAALKVVATRRTIAWNAVLTALAVFLAVAAASVIFVIEPIRYVTFVRNGAMYLTAALLTFVVLQAPDARIAARTLFTAIAIAILISGVVGLLGILGVWRPQFAAPVVHVLPSALLDTDYGARVAGRRIGGNAWFTGLGNYFRVNSLFLFATMYAAAIALTMPVLVHLFRASRWRQRGLWAVAIALVSLNLLFTTGRVAAIALVVGAVVWWALPPRRRGRGTRYALAALATAIAVAAVPLPAWLDVAERTVFARGGGSVNDRWTIYLETIDGWLQRPWLGWGTERDIVDRSGFRYPAGSHSAVLGALYRHGIVGALAFVAVAITLVAGLRVLLTGYAGDDPEVLERYEIMRTGAWTLTTAAVLSMTTVLDLDATVFLLTWTVLAVTIRATQGQSRDGRRAAPAAP
jgi:hypothetical protein